LILIRLSCLVGGAALFKIIGLIYRLALGNIGVEFVNLMDTVLYPARLTYDNLDFIHPRSFTGVDGLSCLLFIFQYRP